MKVDTPLFTLVLLGWFLWCTSFLRPRLLIIQLQLSYINCRTCLTSHVGSICISCHVISLFIINNLGAGTQTHTHAYQLPGKKKFQACLVKIAALNKFYLTSFFTCYLSIFLKWFTLMITKGWPNDKQIIFVKIIYAILECLKINSLFALFTTLQLYSFSC